jgi:hypothetical protein
MPLFEVFVPVSDEFHWELGPYFHFHDLRWGCPVTVLGHSDPGLGTFVPVRAGIREDDWYFGMFSDGLIEFLKRDCREPLVVLMEPDYWLSRDANLKVLDLLAEYMLERPDVLRMHLSVNGNACDRLTLVEEWRGLTVKGDPKGRSPEIFPVSLTPGMWNRELWLQLLRPGWNPWETETKGHEVFLGMDVKSLAVTDPPLEYWHAARTRDRKVALSTMPPEDAAAVRPFVPKHIREV